MSTTAKTLLGTFAIVTAVIAAIKFAESAYDKSHDNLDDLSEKGSKISEELSNVKSDIDKIDEQISALIKQRLSITDSSDISTLNTQIELLKQRKELLEWQYENKKREAENNAKEKIEGTKNDSVYNGASYMDGEKGKLSKGKRFFYLIGGEQAPTTYSAEAYVDTLENRLASIHPEELESVLYNLEEIYNTYDEIVQNDDLIGTETYDIAIEKQKQINELLQETQYLQEVRNGLDKEYINDADFSDYLGGYVLYQKNLNSLIQKGYSNGIVTLKDVKSQFGDYASNLENELGKQERTLEDYVTWLNAASASQIEFLNSSNVNSSATSFKSYSKALNEYKDNLGFLVETVGIEASLRSVASQPFRIFMSASLCLSANRSAWTNSLRLLRSLASQPFRIFMSASLCLSANRSAWTVRFAPDVILCKINKRQQTFSLLSFLWWRRSGSNR